MKSETFHALYFGETRYSHLRDTLLSNFPGKSISLKTLPGGKARRTAAGTGLPNNRACLLIVPLWPRRGISWG